MIKLLLHSSAGFGVFAIFVFLIIIAVLIYALFIEVNAANQREGASVPTAVILSLVLTPATGFLYCLCFPSKVECETLEVLRNRQQAPVTE